jgi:hypothetical protein
MAENPAQKSAGDTLVPGKTSSLTKPCSVASTDKPLVSIRLLMDKFLKGSPMMQFAAP